MSVLILESKDDFLIKKIAELKCQKINFPVIKISNEEDFKKNSFSQGGLFDNKKIFILENILRKKFQKFLLKIKPQLNTHEWIFLEIIPKEKFKYQSYKKSFYAPSFLNKKAKKQNIDRLINSYSFWKEVADSLGVKISYQEWNKSAVLLSENIAFLWTFLEQKRLQQKISLVDLVSSWAGGNIFNLSESLGLKRQKQTLTVLAQFIKEDFEPEIIWYYLIRYFIQMYQLEKGIALSLHPYVLKKMKQQATNFTEKQLEKILAKLMDIDLKIKTGFFESKRKIWEAINLFIFSFFFDL